MGVFIMSSVMKYKGYFAEIRYSDEDECFYGVVDGLKNDSITFEGDSVKELKKDFKEAIDHYLKVCKDTNTKPEEQCKGSLNIRLGVKLHSEAKIKAIEKNISINELMKDAITMYLKQN